MIFIIIILSILLVMVGYALWNQTRKIGAYEETMALYEGWIENFATTIKKIDDELNDLDTEGTFRADDEVGYFFQAMYSILKQLEEFMLIEPEENINEAEDLLPERNVTYEKMKKRNRQKDVTMETIQKLDRKNYKSV